MKMTQGCGKPLPHWAVSASQLTPHDAALIGASLVQCQHSGCGCWALKMWQGYLR